jgi:hypothetical protein
MKHIQLLIVFCLALVIQTLSILPQARAADAALTSAGAQANKARSGNPIIDGWYADPEDAIFENQYWIYPTYSAPYDKQVFFDAFSSPDLVPVSYTL